MSLNIELLKQVRDKIAGTPEAYDQGTYGKESKLAPCGTAACIAGWACLLSGAMDAPTLHRLTGLDPHLVHLKAAKVLGLDESDADILFSGEPHAADDEFGWPEPFRADWEHARRKERPQVAVAYLDCIIETGEVRF